MEGGTDEGREVRGGRQGGRAGEGRRDRGSGVGTVKVGRRREGEKDE